MRRAGQNPTDVEVQDLINKIDDGTGTLDFNDFCVVIKEKNKELDFETHFKDTFRAFSKDDEGDDMTRDDTLQLLSFNKTFKLSFIATIILNFYDKLHL